jgi:hypothetical protein
MACPRTLLAWELDAGHGQDIAMSSAGAVLGLSKSAAPAVATSFATAVLEHLLLRSPLEPFGRSAEFFLGMGHPSTSERSSPFS